MIAKEYIPIYAALIVLALIYIKSKKKDKNTFFFIFPPEFALFI